MIRDCAFMNIDSGGGILYLCRRQVSDVEGW